MLFSNQALSQRLECAEAFAGASFVEARLLADPRCDACWKEIAGAIAIFDGIDSPVTQTFQLGLHEPLSSQKLDEIEDFFQSRGTSPVHEVSPFAGLATLSLLCTRRYQPVEISSVLFQPVPKSESPSHPEITARLVVKGEEALWANISARGWAEDNAVLAASIESFGKVMGHSQAAHCFLAEIDGQPAAAGVLLINHGVALFGGSATLPLFRRRGLQAALLKERMRFAANQGCDLAMMVAEAGSNSQRNAERVGFQVAYTRIKWRLGVC